MQYQQAANKNFFCHFLAKDSGSNFISMHFYFVSIWNKEVPRARGTRETDIGRESNELIDLT
jgi:hypothetical protein